MKAFLFLNILIATLIILRGLFKNKISRKMQYSLWAVIPMFLLLISIISIPVNKTVPNKAVQKIYRFPETTVSAPYEPVAQGTVPMHASSEVSQNVSHSNNEAVSSDSSVSHVKNTNQTTQKKVDIKLVLVTIYIVGALVVAAAVIRSNAMLIKRIKNSREYYDKSSYGNLNVYKLGKINSPFLLLNSIYIPNGMDKNMESYKYSECHEYCHFKQGDYFWNFLECIFIVVLWFDPLVWIAYFMVKKDSEYSVDESVISMLGEEQRANYSQTLLNTASKRTYNIGTLAVLLSNSNYSFLKNRIVKIMNGYKKSTAAILATLFLLTSIVSCSLFKTKDTREVVRVAEDTPWYNCEEIRIGTEYSNIDFSIGSMVSYNIGQTDEGFVYAISGDVEDGTEYGHHMFDICVYSKEGELLHKFELQSYLEENLEEYYTNLFEGGVYLSGNEVKVKLHNLVEDYRIYTVDFENNSLVNFQELPRLDGWEWQWGKYTISINDKTIHTGFAYDMSGDIKFVIEDSEHNMTVCSMKESLGDDCLSNNSLIYPPIPMNDHEMLIVDTHDNNIFILDINSQEIREANDELAWFLPYVDEKMSRSFTHDKELTMISSYEVIKVDFDNSTVDVIALLENIDVNRNEVSWSSGIEILQADSDCMVFAQKSSFSDGVLCVYTATIAESNPNTGKQIITTDGYSNLAYEAVYKFNRTNEDYFVRIVPYSYEYGNGLEYTTEDEWKEALREDRQQVGFQMQVDLVAGECPDVVFYVGNFPQVNNRNCMMDLSSFYNASNLSNQLFDNIISAATEDNGLYAMPLSFSLNGILVDRTHYENPGRVMSLDDYTDFMSYYFNGHNPIGSTQMDFFMAIVNNHYDLFTTDGCPNFDCNEFRKIATYTFENIVNTRLYDSGYYPGCNTLFSTPTDWIDDSRDAYIDINNSDILGLPSVDGRGLAASSYDYVSITNGTNAPEGAWEFICMLYDAEVQIKSFSHPGEIWYGIQSPINKDAFEQINIESLDYVNKAMEYESSIFNDPYTRATEDNINAYVDMASSIDHLIISNGDVEVILYEEMQAYFAGDKTLDEVIDIINSRISLIYEEYN